MKKIIAFGVSFAPFLASAQLAGTAGTNIDTLVAWMKAAMSTATTLILGAAVVFLVWNIFGFVMAAGDEEARKEKRAGIIYGVIGVAVMVSIYGLVAFLTSSAGLSSGSTLTAPTPF